jgi:hypothetical protein
MDKPATIRRDAGASEAIEAARVKRGCRQFCGPYNNSIEETFVLFDCDRKRSEFNRAQECEPAELK